MCRLAAWVGEPVPLSTLIYDSPRGLHELAVEPREQQYGRINVDGTGVAWWPDEHPEPLSYRTQLPPWADPNLPGLAPRLAGRVILAAVRSTTPGLPGGAALVHPFTGGGLAVAHNGWISEYRARVARPLLAEVPDELFGRLDGMSDTAALFLLVLAAHRAGADPLAATEHAVATAARVCRRVGSQATLTLVVAHSGGVEAVNGTVGQPANSLYTRGGMLLASEPLDDQPGWEPVGADETVHLPGS